MTVGLTSGINSITGGQSALQSAQFSSEKGKFEELVRSVYGSVSGGKNLAGEQVAKEGRLNGDFSSGFAGTFTLEKDKKALPVGAAANQANTHVQQRTIDRTSKLYEKSLEMES